MNTTFVGNDGVSLRRLHRLVEDHMLDLSREPTLETIALDAEFDLEDHYRVEGYADVEIKHTVRRDDAARTVDVEFTIVEGPRVTARMTITGNASFPADRLLEFWGRRATGTFGLGDPLFVESEMPAFAAALRAFYRGQGYLEVTVARPTIERVPGTAEADVAIEVAEGPAYRFGEITVAAELAEALGDETVARIQAHTGAIAAALALEQLRTDALTRLRGIGYPGPVVRVTPEAETDANTITVHLAGEAGRRGRVEEVEIRGNERTYGWHIRSHYEFEVGDYYDGRAVDATRRELYLTGLFRQVDIDHEWLGDGETIRLVVTVEEAETKAVDVLGGYGSYELFRGMVRFSENNVFGTGRRFSLEGRLSTKGYRGAATVTDPRFLATKTTLTVTADVFEREEPSFTDRARGITTALTRYLGHGLQARTGYAFRNRDVAEVVNVPADVPESFLQGNVFAELDLDRRDSLLYPTSGFQIVARVDADDPAFGSEITFQRVRVNASAYVPLWANLNLALRASTGALWPGGGLPTVPIQERFFNGGENTVRSFREAQLGPKDAAGEPVGGEFRNVFSAELRSPIIGILDGALFADAGNVGVRVEDYGFDDMRYGIGAGLRLKLPIGPVRFDAAWNPDRRIDERSWVFHLSVGYPF